MLKELRAGLKGASKIVVPTAAGAAGALVGGTLAERLAERVSSLRSHRTAVGIAGAVVGAAVATIPLRRGGKTGTERYLRQTLPLALVGGGAAALAVGWGPRILSFVRQKLGGAGTTASSIRPALAAPAALDAPQVLPPTRQLGLERAAGLPPAAWSQMRAAGLSPAGWSALQGRGRFA